jgi:hypothetical protein
MSFSKTSSKRTKEPAMFTTIFQNTPRGVWILLAVLIALGVSMSFPRRRTLRSATVIPVAMIVLSFYGVVSVFTRQPVAVVAWAGGVAASLVISSAIGAWRNITWSATDRRLIVPGSWIPMVLILGLFTTKYGVNVMLAISPELALDALFATLVGFAYGAFSGSFLGRGVAMWKVAREALQPSMAS